MKKVFIPFAVLALAGTVLGGCGKERESDSGSGGDTEATEPSGGGDAIEVTATEFAYDPAEISVTAGETFTIQLTDAGAIEHNFNIEGAEGVVETKAGETASGEFTLEAGTYKFFCSIAGHEAAGMVGTLIVE